MLHKISTRVYARASTIFRFLPSPLHHVRIKKLINNNLYVKANPLLPSPVKDKKAQHLHPQITSYQSIRGEGEGWRQELPTRWVRDAQGRVRLSAPTRVRGLLRTTQIETNAISQKRSEITYKTRGKSKENPQLLLHHFSNRKKTSIFHHKHTNIRNKCFTFAIDKTQPPFSCRSAASI